MAVMIPAECDLNRRPLSEQVVFTAIQHSLPDEWIVFHSFDYITRDLNHKLWDGEIDFLLYHPEQGLLVIEVKGGTISYFDGQWWQNRHKIDPVEQAKKNKYAVLRLLQQQLGGAAPIKIAHAVCFPDCYHADIWPAEAKDIVLTGDRLNQIEVFAGNVLRNAKYPGNLCGKIAREDVLRILSPCFEYGLKLGDRIRREEKQFFLLTEEQCAILDALENFPRLLIRGCAGSGKTVMAVKKADRLAMQGKHVLLLCYNQLLARYIKKAASPFVTVAPFFDYCIELLKIPPEKIEAYRRDPRLYELLPNLLKDHIFRHCLCYDAVIVDEGQDFSAGAWEAIGMLVPEGGIFYVFYDEDQNIFQKELHLPDFGIPAVKLTRNCRNTKKIFEALKPYHTEESVLMKNAPEGADVHTLHGDCRENLTKELHRLIHDEKVEPGEIVILGAHSLAHTDLGSDSVCGKFRIAEKETLPDGGEIAYYTYMKYKGCEAKVVILYGVDDADPRWDAHGLYTAMSRATHELVILKKD